MGYLIDRGRVYPPRYYWVGPRAPLGYSRAALYAVVVARIWLPPYVRPFRAVASGG